MGELLDLWLDQELPKTVRPENREPYRIVVEKHLKPTLGATRVQRLPCRRSKPSTAPWSTRVKARR